MFWLGNLHFIYKYILPHMLLQKFPEIPRTAVHHMNTFEFNFSPASVSITQDVSKPKLIQSSRIFVSPNDLVDLRRDICGIFRDTRFRGKTLIYVTIDI